MLEERTSGSLEWRWFGGVAAVAVKVDVLEKQSVCTMHILWGRQGVLKRSCTVLGSSVKFEERVLRG